MKFTPEAITRAVRAENGNSKSANPNQDIIYFRDSLRQSFGENSSMFKNTTEGMAYAMHRALYEFDGGFNGDLFDIQELMKTKLKSVPPEFAYQFIHGYVIGISYLYTVWENDVDQRKHAERVSDLLHMFLSPAGTLY